MKFTHLTKAFRSSLSLLRLIKNGCDGFAVGFEARPLSRCCSSLVTASRDYACVNRAYEGAIELFVERFRG